MSLYPGAAFNEAMGKQPVERIGSAIVPMDDALVSVVVDIIDRPFCDADCPNTRSMRIF